jgi:choline kinase
VKAQLIIPMAGRSKRFYDTGYTRPKSLIDVFGLDILKHIIKNFEFISNVLIIVRKDDLDKFRIDKLDYLEDEKIQIVGIDDHSKGPSYSILMAENFINKDLNSLVHYCDVFVNLNCEEMFRKLNQADALFVSFKGFHPSRLNGTTYAYARSNESEPNLISDIREKRSFSLSPEDEDASTGLYGFKTGELLLTSIKNQLDQDSQVNGEFYTSLTLKTIIESGGKVLTYECEVFNAWGTPTDLRDYIYYSTCINYLESFDQGVISVIDHNAVILAAGKSSRLKIQDGKPKQLKKITNSLNLIDCARFLVRRKSEIHLVARQEVYPDNYWNLPLDNIKLLPYGTESQLNSVVLGQQLVVSKEKMITFLASDNLVIFDKIIDLESYFNNCDVLIWTSENYPFAKKDPEKYSWVRINDDGRIEDSIRKKSPPNFIEWRLVIGNFTFKSSLILDALINQLSENIDSYNFELMLDDLIPIAKGLNLEVKNIDIPYFITLGSYTEEEIYNYFWTKR